MRENSEILINGHKYQLVSSETFTAENKTPKHKLENGSETSDNIIIGTPKFNLVIKIFTDEEWGLLSDLQQTKTLFKIVVPQGVYSNVVMTKLSDAYGSSSNTTTCSLTLEVQTITRTETRITELDGLVAAPADSSDLLTVVEDRRDASIPQLCEYYLSNIPAGMRDSEKKRMEGMTTDELWNYLVETQKNLETEGFINALEMDIDGEYRTGRKSLSIPTDFFTNMSLVEERSYVFNITDSGKTTAYTITIRREDYEGQSMFTLWIYDLLGRLNEGVAYHVKIKRKIDDAVMYSGKMTDLTPFCMTDPNTGIKVATLQYTEYLNKIYIE